MRIRGNAPQIYEKYQTLARDAASAGDRIASESYFQFAEHYFRIMNDSTDPQRSGQPPQQQRGRPEQSHGAQERSGRDSGDNQEQQPVVGQEQPHVEWPGNDGAANGTATEAAPTTDKAETEEATSEETAPQRQKDSKPRQRSRRRPANGADEAAAKTNAKAEPVAEDGKAADGADEESPTPVE